MKRIVVAVAAAVFAAVLFASALRAEAAPESPGLSMESLNAAIMASSAARVALIAGKFLPAAIGVVLLIRMFQRREQRVRAGAPSPGTSEGPTVLGGWPVVLALVGVLIAMMAATEAVIARTPLDRRLGAVLVVGVPGVLLGLAVVALRRRISGTDGGVRPTSAAPGAAPMPWPRAVLAGLAGFSVASLLVLPVGFAWQAMLRAFDAPTPVQQPVQEILQADTWIVPFAFALFGGLAAPFYEEALFRGTFYPAARRSLGGSRRAVLIGAVVTSAVFAAIHQNLAALPVLFVLAMVLAAVFERTNSLLAVFTMHAVFNVTSLLPMLLVGRIAGATS